VEDDNVVEIVEQVANVEEVVEEDKDFDSLIQNVE